MPAGFSAADSAHHDAERTSSTLLERARAGHRDAWQRLVTLYGPLVYCWSRRSLDANESYDVVQDVFIAVYKYFDGFRRDRDGDSFRAWLRTITRRKIVDVVRARRDRPLGGSHAQRYIEQLPEPDLDDSDSPVMQQDRLMRRALEVVQAEFEAGTWRAFWLSTVDELDTAQVAALTGKSEGAVRVAKCRVLRRLRELLEHN